jgi:hypothetical protein
MDKITLAHLVVDFLLNMEMDFEEQEPQRGSLKG